MSVRSTVKAIILDNGKVLLNRCYDEPNGSYYSLPGGGQEKYETLFDALKRECREETGYTVEPLRFAALMEEICDSTFIRETYPEYAHKMLHIFVCRLASREVQKPTETDSSQIACEWVDLEEVKNINLLPKAVIAHFAELIESERAMFLGSEHIPVNHG
jgi:ADP-ribose pyrophosphatase YjhB (NUDIX family)